jgi:hypothetical protein
MGVMTHALPRVGGGCLEAGRKGCGEHEPFREKKEKEQGTRAFVTFFQLFLSNFTSFTVTEKIYGNSRHERMGSKTSNTTHTWFVDPHYDRQDCIMKQLNTQMSSSAAKGPRLLPRVVHPNIIQYGSCSSTGPNDTTKIMIGMITIEC